eukprot:2637938-Alexandrium_andersonii.AAC.1
MWREHADVPAVRQGYKSWQVLNKDEKVGRSLIHVGPETVSGDRGFDGLLKLMDNLQRFDTEEL